MGWAGADFGGVPVRGAAKVNCLRLTVLAGNLRTEPGCIGYASASNYLRCRPPRGSRAAGVLLFAAAPALPEWAVPGNEGFGPGNGGPGSGNGTSGPRHGGGGLGNGSSGPGNGGSGPENGGSVPVAEAAVLILGPAGNLRGLVCGVDGMFG